MSVAGAFSLTDAVLKMAQEAGGKPFPLSAVADLGGWARITSEASTLAAEPALPIVATIVARDARPDDIDAAEAAAAVVDAVVASVHPALFRDSLDALLDSPVVIQVVGSRLVTALEPVVAGFLTRTERDVVADLASADALEVMTRLVAAGHGSHFSLLAMLQKFTVPIVAPMSRAVIRSVNIAIDVWPEADSLISVVRVLGGVDTAPGADPDLAADVESDAAWVLASISLLRSLRAASVQDMDPHLDDATRFYEIAANAHHRPDAAPMLSIVEALHQLVNGVVSGDAMSAMKTTSLSAEKLAEVREQIHKFSAETSGLNHWYGDSKRATLTAWARLSADLERMGRQLGKDGFYQAEVVVRDLLTIYECSRSFGVGSRHANIFGVQDLIRPAITEGFARNASHLSNLEEYATDLASRSTGDLNGSEKDQLHAAQSIIKIARRVAMGDETPGKGDGVLSTPLPPLIGRLVPPGSDDEELLAQISSTTLTALEQRLDHVAAGRSHLNLVQQEIFDVLRKEVSACPDYQGDVIPAVDHLLLLIINFVTSRTGSSASHYGYLFDASAKEEEIHEDLYNYLVSNLGSRVEYEVSHVGGGRVDIRLKFDNFALHIEVKVDDTQLPMHDRTAYLKQAVTYQGNDIRIGILVALRHKAFDLTGPPPHIKTLIGHTAFKVEGDLEPRHIVHVAIPGSRVNPSRSR